MLNQDLIGDANRQFGICNACRYCEGICAVFPAMELRAAFAADDLSYLAALCHDCRACLDACPFAPPHEFAVDVPSLMAQARMQTFEQYARPQLVWRVLAHGRSVAGVVVATILFASVVSLATGDPSRIMSSHTGRGSFYQIIAWVWLLIPASTASVLAFVAILAGVQAFAADTPGGAARLLSLVAQKAAARDVLTLRNLGGGGGGCPTMSGRLSGLRRHLHHLTFYGFAAMFAATIAAAFEQDVLGILPPYALVSVPVITGTVGGLSTTAGVIGFLVISAHRRWNEVEALNATQSYDRLFSFILLAAVLSGLLTLAARSSRFMGVALILHLGAVGGLILTLPYSKFVHSVYRYVALVRSHVEASPAAIAVVQAHASAVDPTLPPVPRCGQLNP